MVAHHQGTRDALITPLADTAKACEEVLRAVRLAVVRVICAGQLRTANSTPEKQETEKNYKLRKDSLILHSRG